jgi:hypothetical protein
MAAKFSLSRRDVNVLEMIKDPESDPSLTVFVDTTLPKDPHIRDHATYDKVAEEERDIIQSIQKLESPQTSQNPTPESEQSITEGYRNSVARLGRLVDRHPSYASARNNRAQALRRLCGDSVLVQGAPQLPQALLRNLDDAERLEMAQMLLSDLDRAILLLTPAGRFPTLSPQASRTLSQAHTQRAAIYLKTSKLMVLGSVSLPPGRHEVEWTKLDFEENASKDFAMGGRYGNEIAKNLAVSTNPTAKLCGEMVREAMRKEYGPDYAM